MKYPVSITFNLSNHNLSNFKHIEVNGEKIHFVVDVQNFLEILGYSAEISKKGLLADEFLWEEYIRHGADKSQACLQAKLIEYLREHSEIFRSQLSEEIEIWLNLCHSSMPGVRPCRAACPFVAL